jgi:hypothetical protein
MWLGLRAELQFLTGDAMLAMKSGVKSGIGGNFNVHDTCHCLDSNASRWPYSRSWGYYPSGGLGLVVVILLVLILAGRL